MHGYIRQRRALEQQDKKIGKMDHVPFPKEKPELLTLPVPGDLFPRKEPVLHHRDTSQDAIGTMPHDNGTPSPLHLEHRTARRQVDLLLFW